MFRRSQLLAQGLSGFAAVALIATPASAAPQAPPKDPIAVGRGGAVSSVDPYATEVGLDVLRRGGNAVDAAVATAAALGVTEPYSAGIGGGGFFVYYDARSGRVHTIDGRETAPALMEEDAFVENGVAIPFAEAVTQWAVGRRAGDAGNLGTGSGQVGIDRPSGRASPGGPAGRQGFRGRCDVPPADNRQCGPVR